MSKQERKGIRIYHVKSAHSLLFFFLQQGKVLIQFGLNLLHAFICVFGGGVQLLFQQTQTDAGFTQLLALGESVTIIIPVLFLIPFVSKLQTHLKLFASQREEGCLQECVTLILSDFLSSLMTVSLSSSFTPRPSASVISALTVDARTSTGGV